MRYRLGLSLFLLMLIIQLTPIRAVAVSGNLQIYFLDVGQGDAMILHHPGRCTALVDAGPPINAHRITEKLENLGVSTLDFVIITHPHPDHYGGLFDLAPNIKIKRLLDNGGTDSSSRYYDKYRVLKTRLPYTQLSKGDRMKCGEIKISILHPKQTGNTSENANDDSLVALITYYNFRLLQMGDLAGPAEKTFVSETAGLEADVIKIAHHGAADSTSLQLLKAVQPKYAIISTASKNLINSPAETVLQRLSNNHIKVLRTDRDKTTLLEISEQGYSLFSPDK